jgi:hypothetical protein
VVLNEPHWILDLAIDNYLTWAVSTLLLAGAKLSPTASYYTKQRLLLDWLHPRELCRQALVHVFAAAPLPKDLLGIVAQEIWKNRFEWKSNYY